MAAALTLAAGVAIGAPHGTTRALAAAPPAAPLDGRDDQISRDDSRPELQPKVVRALDQRRAGMTRASVDIAMRERTLRVGEFVKQRARAEKAVRYAETVKARGYDPFTTAPRYIAKKIMLDDYQWGEDQFACYDRIITQESNWKWDAENPSSGAYGIPQSLPANKMATAGDDWKTNPATQLTWGLKYVQQRYGTPCKAWDFKRDHGWY